MTSPLDKRRAGVLLHPTSLPGPSSNGELGDDAFLFVDFLSEAGFSVWQTLPLVPTHQDLSPYSSISTNAGNEKLISLTTLHRKGLIDSTYDGNRNGLLKQAWINFKSNQNEQSQQAFSDFMIKHESWLIDYALFVVLHDIWGGIPWWEWQPELRYRDPDRLQEIKIAYANDIESVCFTQFQFFTQWHALRDYANQKGILLLGDIPLFVAADSADVWSNQSAFRLDKEGRPSVVAGVPPDYFSETGQRWGNPHYDWEFMKSNGFNWWKKRIENQLEQFDWLRIDHFRGLESSWEIPQEEETAINGHWIKVPGFELLTKLSETFEHLPFIAEDLGVITDEVEHLRDEFDLPGMKILQFAFNNDHENPYLPENHIENCVVYTGTHDNNTTLGWYQSLNDDEQNTVKSQLENTDENIVDAMLDCAFSSVAKLAVIPFQDVLKLDAEHRMNVPGEEGGGNWRWRFTWDQVPENSAEKMHRLLSKYGRDH